MNLQIEMCKYLGVMIDREGNMAYEIRERIKNIAKLHHSLSRVFIYGNLRSVDEQRWQYTYDSLVTNIIIWQLKLDSKNQNEE